MDDAHIFELTLNNFRNYSGKKFAFSGDINIIVGNNGAGKTNILEALSLFSNSNGLRNAPKDELTNVNRNCPFLPPNILYSILISFSSGEKISVTQEKERKIIKINGEIVRRASVLNDFLNITFLAPHMDNFFMENSSVRRKFLDKTAEIMFREHYENVKKYEFFVKERMKILTEQKWDDNWLNIVEKKIVSLGVGIAETRNEVVELLNRIFSSFTENFPTGNLEIVGEIENLLGPKKSMEVEKFFLERLRDGRMDDARNKRTALGAHRSDIVALHAGKKMRADLCSTGEQKMLLVSLILARCIFSKLHGAGLPVLLLDEACSHLDEEARLKLFQELRNISVQTFITGIKREDFTNLGGNIIEL
ncbi:MAG: DNA replication and repair protein RecF [Rickettsiales bacterium]|jgi:DNA replication and repair protein RecF|nr:DNA replication and repair protein RecF [Rickettsiales bacterium]